MFILYQLRVKSTKNVESSKVFNCVTALDDLVLLSKLIMNKNNIVTSNAVCWLN